MDLNTFLRQYEWKKSLKNLSFFNMGLAKTYVGEEGSQRLFREGYSLFVSSYVKDAWTSENGGAIIMVKACCFTRLRKNDPPRQVFFELTKEVITASHCSCKAGAGKCIHLAALFHYINHCVLMDFEEIPEETTCTSQEQQWHKPRGDQIEPEPIMDVIFAKPNEKRKRNPMVCTLNTIECYKVPKKEDVRKMTEALQGIDTDFPFSYLLDGNRSGVCSVSLCDVPCGSTLAQQWKDFIPHSHAKNRQSDYDASPIGERFPDIPVRLLECPEQCDIDFITSSNLNLDMQAAINLEESTRGQADSTLWFMERRKRITSSQFGLICKWKKQVSNAFLSSLVDPKNLDHVPAVAYGKKQEKNARKKYMEVKTNAGSQVTVYLAGMVVNPGIPFLGSSPDGKVIDKSEEPPYGLLEIKCPKSKQNKSFQEACLDKKFYCELRDGKICLKKRESYFYQVQGQMWLSGLTWCDFVIYNGEDVHVERINVDVEFCKEMVDKLCKFYNTHIIPFIQATDLQ